MRFGVMAAASDPSLMKTIPGALAEFDAPDPSAPSVPVVIPTWKSRAEIVVDALVVLFTLTLNDVIVSLLRRWIGKMHTRCELATVVSVFAVPVVPASLTPE